MLMVFSAMAVFSGCKKDLDSKLEDPSDPQSVKKSLTKRARTSKQTNPYSRANIEKALTALGRPTTLDPDRLYHYYQFAPELVTGAILAQLEADTSSKILDFPMANMALYPSDNSTITQADIDATKDGKLYIVLKSNSNISRIFGPGNSLNAVKLEELYLPESNDEALQTQAMIEVGIIDESGLIIDSGIIADPNQPEVEFRCRRKPTGYVTYQDQHQGVRAVPGIQVWALAFGIPRVDFTDDNGKYNIDYEFSFGTLLGTHAKNYRVNIKPLNTTGTWLGAAASLVSNFILGSTKTDGSYSSCRMRNDINIHFGIHDQPQYWAQLMDLMRQHDIYTWNDDIFSAPVMMTIYAQWDATTGRASAPMLGYIGTNSLLAQWANHIFSINLSVQIPTLFQLMTGLMPDITVKQSPTFNGSSYSQSLSHTMFHELGHASLYQKVGPIFWTKVIVRTVLQNGYGNQGSADWGLVQANEAWAEFIGKEHHSRFHVSTSANTVGTQACFIGVNNCSWLPYPAAKERAATFAGRDWINTGIFHDFMDGYHSSELNDNISGFSISTMFSYFSSATTSLCHWRLIFMQQNPSVPVSQIDALMKNQNGWTAAGCK